MRRAALWSILFLIACGANPAPIQPAQRADQAAPLPAHSPMLAGVSFPDPLDPKQSRDPFKCELQKPAPPPPMPFQGPVKARNFALDELQLIGLIGGSTIARAMFRTPTGEGILVKRGERISKAAGRVKWILSDRVIVQITKTGMDDPGESDLVIALHPAS